MGLLRACLVFILLCAGWPAFAQGQQARLLVTVADTTGAVIPGAKVAVIGLEETTKASASEPVQTSPSGIAMFPGLTPGRYSISAEFGGFEPGLLTEVRLRPGDNKQLVVLKIQGLQETVNVGVDGQASASNRASQNFGVELSDQQLDALSDDPDELQKQLQDMAGSNATIRIDSFEGLALPPKAQIKSVHVTRDQFAAESAYPGNTFIDIITQPGVGPIRGSANSTLRAGSLTARNPFAQERGVDQNQRYGLTVGGALAKDKSSFSLNVNGSHQLVAPFVHVATPGGTRRETLNVKSPVDQHGLQALVDYALTRDQTLRFGYYDYAYDQRNQGIGAYDLPGRAYSSSNTSHYARLQHAGPIGRRIFVNTRGYVGLWGSSRQSAVEAPTIVVQDAFTSGGAQHRGGDRQRFVNLSSDLDYIRGINSWRTGVQLNTFKSDSDNEDNYLGTYTFPDTAAYEAGAPSLYTRRIGDPRVSYHDVSLGAYVQDDLRVSKGLTLSPGVRYSIQPTFWKHGGWEPRFGATWAPTPGGKTTLRASAGVFHNFVWNGIYEQAIRVDGVHQQELVVVNPSYPDPGAGGATAPSNKYLIGRAPLGASVRYSGGVDQTVTSGLKVNVLYNYVHETGILRGLNLNAPVNGVRPDPQFANVIETITDAEIRRHELFTNINFNFAPGQGASQRRLNWKRVAGTGSYNWIRARRNAVGPFDPPPSGTLDTEWGNGPADAPYQINLSVNSTQLRNLTVNLSWNARSGSVYMETTGLDDNQDGIINDRPAGVGIWTLRGTPQSTLSARVTYTVTPGAVAGAAASAIRYRLAVFVAANNLTNRPNYSGFSGVKTSPFFEQPTTVTNPRRVEVGMNVSF